jgi:hypothetical protein
VHSCRGPLRNSNIQSYVSQSQERFDCSSRCSRCRSGKIPANLQIIFEVFVLKWEIDNHERGTWVVPLRMITSAGFVIFWGSMLVTLWALWVRFFTDKAIPGWTSIVLPMYFLGGIQIFCIGMLGEYLGKAHPEAK